MTANSVIDVVPEILPVAGHTAEEFGYEGTTFPDPNSRSYPSSTIVKYYSLGADGAAFSDDDYCYSYTLQDYVSYHMNKDAKIFDTVDGQLHNGDDIINGWWNTEPTADKGSWKTGDPGNDYAWFTADDVIVRTEDWSGTPQAGILYQPICTDTGPDQVWFSPDDVQTGDYLDTLRADGNLVKRAYYSGTGTNGVLANDWFGAYYINTYEGDNNHWWSWTRQDRFNVDGTIKEYVIHEFGDPRFPRFFTKEIYFNSQGQVTHYAIAENVE